MIILANCGFFQFTAPFEFSRRNTVSRPSVFPENLSHNLFDRRCGNHYNAAQQNGG
jgi:hypothetical protein